MSIAIVIPARYGSSRFPGKPLAKIAGKTMLEHVVSVAYEAVEEYGDINVYVATEDQRIADHAKDIDVQAFMTSEDCKTGTDRVLEAVNQMENRPDFAINLQGDAAFIPASVIRALIDAYLASPSIKVVTPVQHLSWDSLDRLQASKKDSPFSGTTAIMRADGQALWFSKHIIPAIRKEVEKRQTMPLSPVYRHIGLYGYRTSVLEEFCNLPEGVYERMEGLEQLRFLENGIPIQTIAVPLPENAILSGIDTPEDLARAETWFQSQTK